MQRVIHGLAMLISTAVLALMAVNIWSFIFVKKIELFSVDSPLAYAFLVLMALAIFLVINGIQEIRWLKLQGDEGGNTKQGFYDLLWVVAYMAAILLYIHLLKYLHFLLGTFIFMSLGMFLLNDSGKKIGVKLAKVLLAAGITVPVLYAVFNVAFDVMLP
jgi:hypothetical protein